MKGFFAARGLRISQRRIGQSLKMVAPVYHYARTTRTERQTNPIPYTAEYFGHKIHIDQNEKLVMYGVALYAAVDGFSGMIVAFAVMPVKNPITIYGSLFE